MAGPRRAEGEIDDGAAGAQGAPEGAPGIDAAAMRLRHEAPGAHLVVRQAQFGDQPLRLGDLLGGHLGEIFRLQHLAVRHGEAGRELDLVLARLRRLRLVLEGAGDALRAGLRLFGGPRSRRQHLCQDLLEGCAAAPEDPERLVEQHRMLVPLHEDRVQGPVEILARADARRLHGGERVEHHPGPQR
jgi:hypothetical protein